MTQISTLTLISHITWKFELKHYYSNTMTSSVQETTPYIIFGLPYVQSWLLKLEILHLTRLPYFVWTIVSPFCVPVPFRAAFFRSNIYIQLFDQCCLQKQTVVCVITCMYQTLTDCIIWCTTAIWVQYFKLQYS